MNGKVMAAFTAAFIAVLLAPSAEAKQRHHYRHHHYHHRFISDRFAPEIASGAFFQPQSTYLALKANYRHRRSQQRAAGVEQIVSHPAGCPHSAFCGCGVSVKVFGRPIRELYLAANWFKFPHASPGPGMVAVRNHHVMYIESVDANGNAVVYDPNSGGHQTRIHTRSLSGYSIRNPNGSRVAHL